MNDSVRWGILGTGDICRQFADDLRHVPNADLRAVGSRRQATADRFGDTHAVPIRCASYEDLVAHPDVDAVYVGTPHPFHMQNALLAIGAGRHVLCEKPLGLNLHQVETMFDAAEQSGVFLMEAMWTYFFPAIQQVGTWIEEGAIGKPQYVRADFHYAAPRDPAGRLYNRDLGGGALLDIGVYALAVAQFVFGQEPVSLTSSVRMADTGVDEQSTLVLEYGDEGYAVLTFGFRMNAPKRATVVGTDGVIELCQDFYQPDTVILRAGNKETPFTAPRKGFGYHYEAQHATDCILKGKRESAIMPRSASVRLIHTMDRVRRQWGLVYPTEVAV